MDALSFRRLLEVPGRFPDFCLSLARCSGAVVAGAGRLGRACRAEADEPEALDRLSAPLPAGPPGVPSTDTRPYLRGRAGTANAVDFPALDV